jgi:hypothetical protein
MRRRHALLLNEILTIQTSASRLNMVGRCAAAATDHARALSSHFRDNLPEFCGAERIYCLIRLHVQLCTTGVHLKNQRQMSHVPHLLRQPGHRFNYVTTISADTRRTGFDETVDDVWESVAP